MLRKGVGRVLLALSVCGAIGLTAVPGAQAAADFFVKIAGVEGEYDHGSPCDVGTCGLQLYSYQWSAVCATCAGVPSEADFQLSLLGSAFEPSSCLPKQKRVSGSLTLTSADPRYAPETTVTSVSGRLRDHKGFFVDGMVSSGAFAGYSVSVFASLPPDPCEPGDFTATVTFYPPVGNPAELAPPAGT